MIKLASAGEEWILTEVVHLAGAQTPWEVEIEFGSLAIAGLGPPDPEDEMASLLFYTWEGPRGLRFVSLVMPGADGTSHLTMVPAGRGALVRPPLETIFDPRTWVVLREVDVPEGEEALADLR